MALGLLFITGLGKAHAQNANRSGFFIEAGIGGTVGNTPRISATLTENYDFYFTSAGGASWSIGFGQRFRTSRHFAYDIKAEVQSTIDCPVYNATVKFYPVGIRYISPEPWRNYSFYASACLGGALSSAHDQLPYNESYYEYILTPGETLNFKLDGDESFGIAYSLEAGININNHLYGGIVWDAQYMFAQYRYVRSNLNWGMVAFKIGYKF